MYTFSKYLLQRRVKGHGIAKYRDDMKIKLIHCIDAEEFSMREMTAYQYVELLDGVPDDSDPLVYLLYTLFGVKPE